MNFNYRLHATYQKVHSKKKEERVGNGLLSHRVAPALPSTLVDFTAGFEMDPGVSPPLLSPTTHPYTFNYTLSLLLYNP